jgi:RNA polymerase sigma-70 factor (ECF subfamily)
MGPSDSFAECVAGLRACEDAAAREVFDRFARRLVALARRRFTGALGARVDPEDVVQSAYKSFFLRYREGKLEAGNWSSLWGLLTHITLCKCADRVEYYRAARRDVAREVPIPDSPGSPPPWCAVIDREPSPVEAAVLAETVEQILAGLEDGERAVVELSLQGYTTREISEQLGRAERTVRRLRERVKGRLKRLREGDPEGGKGEG